MPLRSVRDRVLALRSLESMTQLEDEAVQLMAEHTRDRWFREGETVLREGEPIENVYLVLSGRIKVTRKGKHVAIVVRPRGVGLLSVFARDPGGVTAVALEDTHALETPVDAVMEAIDGSFSFIRNSLRLASGAVLKQRANLPADPSKPPKVELGTWTDRPRTLVERIMSMAGVGIFADSNLDAVIDIARRLQEVRVEPGHVFWEAGDPADATLRIQYGRLRCTAPDGQHVDVGSGYVLGGLDAFAGSKRAFSVRAETKVIGFLSSSEAMLNVLETHRDLALDLQAVFSRELLEQGN